MYTGVGGNSDESRERYWHKLQFNFSAGKHWIPIARESSRALLIPPFLTPVRRFIDERLSTESKL